MQPHLIISDIDGTLAVDHTKVTAPTVKVLNQLMAAGHQFYVASGRMYALAEFISSQVSPEAQIIASNGAVYDFNGHREHHLLGEEALTQIEQVTAKYELPAFYFSDNQVFYTKTPPKFIEKALMSFSPDQDVVTTVQLPDLPSLLAHEQEITNGFVLSPHDPAGLAHTMVELGATNLLHLSASNHDNIELIPKNVDKSTAIKELQEKTGIPASRTIVFGDGMNDIGMLQAAGISVAMANAVPEVSAAARFMTNANTEDGVARFLQNYFKL